MGSKKKAVVFGGSGFVGSHVCDALTMSNIETIIYDLEAPIKDKHQEQYIKGDILDFDMVSRAIKGTDFVYHLAGQADIGKSFEDPVNTLKLNVNGTVNILEACKIHKVDRFIFASTVYVYSDSGGFYRVSKQSSEIIIEEYKNVFDLNYTILRYGSLYGPRAGPENFIAKIIDQALKNKKIEIGLGIDEKREFIHVMDAAKMSVDILKEEYKNQHVMLTGYQPMSRREVAQMVNEMLGSNIKIVEKKPELDRIHGHYNFTPYIFKPKLSSKIVSNTYIDFGQGLLNCLENAFEKNNE